MDSTEENKHILSQFNREYDELAKFRFSEVKHILPTAAESLCRFQSKPDNEKTLGDTDYAQFNLFNYANDQNNNSKINNNPVYSIMQPTNTCIKDNSAFSYPSNKAFNSINLPISHPYNYKQNEEQHYQPDINNIYLQTYLTSLTNLPYEAAQVLLNFSQSNELSPVSSSSSTLSPTNAHNLTNLILNQNSVQSTNKTNNYLNQCGIEPPNYQSFNMNSSNNDYFPIRHFNISNNDENALLNSSQSNKRPKSTFPFGKCKVCSDKATGVHYGIATCEGCKVRVSFYLLKIYLTSN
jgi:hypothetical protein